MANRRGPKSSHAESKSELGRAIRDRRKGEGLTTPELAYQAGITDAAITQLETGETLGHRPTIESISRALKTNFIPLWEKEKAQRKLERIQSPKLQTPAPIRDLADSIIAALVVEGVIDIKSSDVQQKLNRFVTKHLPSILKEKERRSLKKGI